MSSLSFHCSLQLLNHPFRALKFLKQSALKSVEKQSSRWVWSNFTSKQLYWLLAVYFLPMMTVQVIVASVSMALFTGAILFMSLVTMQIVIDSERVQSQVEYFSLFQLFNTKGDQLHPPVQKSDILHYVVFLVGLMVAIVTLGLSNQSFVYYEVLVILSAVISFLVMVQFDLHESSLFWLFILAKSLSWVVVIIEKLCALFTFSPPPFLNPDTLSDPVFTLPLFDELTFEISPLTIVQVTFHVCLLATQLKNLDWKLFFSKLGPHILFFCWFVLCRFFVSHSSAKHLAIISTAIALFPFTTFTFLVSPIIFLYRYGLTVPFYFSVVSVIIVSIFSVLAFVSFKYWKSWWLNRSLEYVLLGVLVLLFGLVLFLSAWYSSIFQLGTPTSPVTVEEYGRYCGPKNWLDGNMVQTQINCMHLRGREFSAHADVESVSISEAVDGMANSIKLFPLFLQRAITCHLGSVAPMCGDHKDMSTCVYNGCHFQHTLTYTFEIKLKIPIENEGSVKATLIVSNHHKEFVLNLKSGMSLQFNAAFVDGMGSDHLTLRALFLDAPGLDNTQSLEEERKEKIRQNMWSVFHQGVKNGVLVILEIFFGYAL